MCEVRDLESQVGILINDSVKQVVRTQAHMTDS